MLFSLFLPVPPPGALTGVGFLSSRPKAMMLRQLARHPEAVTTKGGEPWFEVTEHRDVSPRPTLRLDRRGLHSFPSSEQAPSGCPGPLELRHRPGPSLLALRGRQHPQSPARPVLQHRPP